MMRTIWTTIATIVLSLVAVEASRADDAAGLAAWDKIQSVLQHPRCMNCHQATSPLQGDARKPHAPMVSRGPDGTGAGSMRCAMCHKATNNSMTGVPGAAHWRLAPVEMVWQDLAPPALCAMLKDPKRNGNRDGAALVHHMEVEPLVLWGWAPGEGRAAVPLSHKVFIAQMREWVSNGMPCPK